ncbi:MAG: hypothetical protein ABIL74_03915 [candidate division WOR-3 bacterium]
MAALFVPILSLFLTSQDAGIEIDLAGNTFFTRDYLLEGHRRFKNKEAVEKYIQKILDHYGDAGFPFTAIRPEWVIEDSLQKKIILHIEEGTRVVIRDGIFKTAHDSEIAPLKKIARLRKNQYFSLSTVRRIKKNLSRLKIFDEISEKILKKDDDYFLCFELKEKSTDYLIAGAAITRETRYYALEFSSLNIFKTLRQCNFNYTSNVSGTPTRKDLKINLSDPVLLSPVQVNTGIQFWSLDTARLLTLNTGFDTPLIDFLTFSLTSGYEMASYRIAYQSYEYSHTQFGLELKADFSLGRVKLLNFMRIDWLMGRHERWRICYDGNVIYSALYLRPHYRLVRTERFEYFDYWHIGGAQSLRGYQEYEFLVKQAYWINFEYKKLPVYPLVDIASLDGEIKIAYGGGIDARTNLFDMTLAFAFPQQGNWQDGKVHITLKRNL